MSNSFIKGISSIFIANIIGMVFGLLSNFILPKYLSINSYSALKLYQLYISYIGLLHLGYSDGIYLKYGGKNFSEIGSQNISITLFTLKVFQLCMGAVVILISIMSQNDLLLAFGFTILPMNTIDYFRLVFQAIGEFERYSNITKITALMNFLINMLLVFVFRTDDYHLFLASLVVWNILLWIYLELEIKKTITDINSYKKFSLVELKDNIQTGLPLTLGNFSSVLLTSIDRWFVKGMMSTVSFAYYSFAVSTEGFINIALTPISVTLYNYFCNHYDIKKIIKIRNIILIFTSYIVSCGFGVKFIVEIYLDKYQESISIIFLLFASQIFYTMIRSIYVNMYKVEKKQNDYFKKLLFVVIAGVLLNIFCYSFLHKIESFAIGTLLSSIIWLLICCLDFKNVSFGLNELIYIFLTTILFIGFGICFSSILGFILYIICISVLSWILLRKDIKYFQQIILEFIKKK